MIIKRKFIDEDVYFDFMYTLERRENEQGIRTYADNNIVTDNISGISNSSIICDSII